MREGKYIILDKKEDVKSCSQQSLVMADFVYCIKENIFIKHRYVGVSNSKVENKQAIPVRFSDRIDYWI